MKKTLLLAAVALGAMTSAALAGPVALTDAQMDTVTAGAQVTVDLRVNAIADGVHVTAGRIPQNGPSTNTPDCLIFDLDGANVVGRIEIMLREPRDAGY